MSDEKMRAEFEGWARSRAIALWMHPNGSGKYYCGAAQQAFEAWQASRKALCVELPKRISEDEDWPSDCWNNAITYCERALDKAGVSYK